MYHFIINPHSRTGKARHLWEQLRPQLTSKKVEFKEYFTERNGHATLIAQKICKDEVGIKNIIIVGGDGTANEVINGIDSYQNVVLGYIPTGSSNDLARGLKLPKDPLAALEHILNPKHFTYVDHGIITFNDSNITRKFAVSCGLGYDATVCHEVLRSKIKKMLNKIGLGKLTYIVIAVKKIFTNIPTDAEIIIDGHKKKSVHNMIFIASMIHKYEGGGLLISPKAKPDDRKLSICLVSNIPKLKVLLLMPTIFFGKHTHIKGVDIFDCSTLDITTANNSMVHTDGEYCDYHKKVRISCTKEQIRMIV